MIGRLPPLAHPARAERSVPYSTPLEFASRWKHNEPLQRLPANDALLDPQVKDTVDRLHEALQKLEKPAPESAVQKAFTDNLCGPMFKLAEAAEDRVVLNTATKTALGDDQTGVRFKPDLVVTTRAKPAVAPMDLRRAHQRQALLCHQGFPRRQRHSEVRHRLQTPTTPKGSGSRGC